MFYSICIFNLILNYSKYKNLFLNISIDVKIFFSKVFLYFILNCFDSQRFLVAINLINVIVLFYYKNWKQFLFTFLYYR